MRVSTGEDFITEIAKAATDPASASPLGLICLDLMLEAIGDEPDEDPATAPVAPPGFLDGLVAALRGGLSEAQWAALTATPAIPVPS